MASLPRRLAAEFLGTYALVFAGTTAIVVNSGGAIGHAGVALVFGLVVFALISALGDVSGAHFNPAVTVAFLGAGRFSVADTIPYIFAQTAGAVLASLTVRLLFPLDAGLGATIPSGSPWQSWVLELLLSAGLMFVILGVSTGATEKGLMAGAAIGATVGLEAMFAGPVCGASMNPARSLGPALVAGRIEHLWIYLSAPVVGALLAVPVAGFVHGGARAASSDPSPAIKP